MSNLIDAVNTLKLLDMAEIKFDDNKLVELLATSVPEFGQTIAEEFRFSAYIIYGNFGLFLQELILTVQPGSELIERGFRFINELVERGDDRILEMMRVTTFEILVDTKVVVEESKKYLTGKSLEIYLKVASDMQP